MARMADCIVNLGDITGYYAKDKNSFEIRQLTRKLPVHHNIGLPRHEVPGFETLALVFSDAVISALMEAKNQRSVI